MGVMDQLLGRSWRQETDHLWRAPSFGLQSYLQQALCPGGQGERVSSAAMVQPSDIEAGCGWGSSALLPAVASWTVDWREAHHLS